MANKPRRTASCPRFISRVDYQGQSVIQCTGWNLLYFDRQERDGDYAAACCENPQLCPLKRVPPGAIMHAARSNDKATPSLWPTAIKYPTTDTLIQEARNHERK